MSDPTNQDTEVISYKNCDHVRVEHFPMKFPPYPTEQEIKVDGECAMCTLAKVRQDVKAQEYLTRKLIERFQNSPVERLRRFAHNVVHAIEESMQVEECLVCGNLTRNRLEPKTMPGMPASQYLNHSRPSSH